MMACFLSNLFSVTFKSLTTHNVFAGLLWGGYSEAYVTEPGCRYVQNPESRHYLSRNQPRVLYTVVDLVVDLK